jgi:methylsterol monooxygenase
MSTTLWLKYIYDPCKSHFGENCYFFLFVVATQLLHLTTFWLHSLLLCMIDLNSQSRISKYLRNWKSQPNIILDKEKIYRAIRMALFNQFFVNTTFSIFVYVITKSRILHYGIDNYPTIAIILKEFTIFVIVEEIGFYYGHLLMHSSVFYSKIHKIHHEFTAPIGCACIYAHPIEHILCNLLPVIAGPFICQSHMVTYWLWLTIAVFTTMTSHSGYHFPFLPSNEAHDFHHLKFNTNYGVLGILDWLHGTNKLFQDTPQESRHRVFLSLSDVKYMNTNIGSKTSSSSSNICDKQK